MSLLYPIVKNTEVSDNSTVSSNSFSSQKRGQRDYLINIPHHSCVPAELNVEFDIRSIDYEPPDLFNDF